MSTVSTVQTSVETRKVVTYHYFHLDKISTIPPDFIFLSPQQPLEHSLSFYSRPMPMAASFGSATKLSSLSIFFLAIILLFLTNSSISESTDPTPTPWPPQFHSIMIYNTSGTNQIFDLWYDYPNGRNFNIIQNQLGELLYDLEWNNGTKFVYTLDSNKKCQTVKVGFGILTPDWLDGANYLGQRTMDGFLCNVWEKVDFIWYYEDVVTKRPVHWAFYTGMEGHLMTFEVGAVLEDEKWQAPVYCFESGEQADDSSQLNSVVDNSGSPMDLVERKMLIQKLKEF